MLGVQFGFGLNLPQGLHRLIDMGFKVELGIKDMSDPALEINHVGDPTGQNSQGSRNPVAFADLISGIAQELKR